MKRFITNEGLRMEKLFTKYGLGEYYQEMMGNIVIDNSELTPEVWSKVIKLLQDNPYDLISGFEGEGEEQYLFVANRTDLDI